MIKGYATAEGTQRYENKFSKQLASDYFRKVEDLSFSSIGIGSYLGDATDLVDVQYGESFIHAYNSGINVWDTAANYRFQRSERVIGKVLSKLIELDKVKRDELVLCTKGGFFPFEDEAPGNPAEYIKENYIAKGLCAPDDIAQGCHAMNPEYLESQLNQSLKNLNVETIDIYYLHNPETQLMDQDRDEFNERIKKAFSFLEDKVREGKIRYYGIATWNACRMRPESAEYLSLESLVTMAREVAGHDHHFKFAQMPINMAMPEAWVLANQNYGPTFLPTLKMAEHIGIHVISSGSLLQGKLTTKTPDFLKNHFSPLEKGSQISLQFLRSLPGLTTALVGMKNKDHVLENLEAGKHQASTEEELIRLFQNQQA